MEKKKNKLKKENKLDYDEDKLKYEVANELGLLERVMKHGWKSLTAKETGRIGGLVTKRKRAIQLKRDQQA